MGNIHIHTAKSCIYTLSLMFVSSSVRSECVPHQVCPLLYSPPPLLPHSPHSQTCPHHPLHIISSGVHHLETGAVSLLNVQYTSLRVCRVWWAYANLLGCIQSPRDQCSPHCRSFSQPQRTRCPSVDDPSTHVASLHVCNHLSDMEPLFSPPRRCI